MQYLCRFKKVLASPFVTVLTLLLLAFSFIACKSERATAKSTVQKTFAAPEDASAALSEAARSANQEALLAIFGPDGKDVLFSGDPVKDKDALQDFAAAYDQMHRWREVKVGGQMLYIGADNFVFPIPLGQNQTGQWYFDTDAGKDEILARRIGRDELTAIAACAAIADAQNQYFSETHDGDNVKQYAQKLVSDEGKKKDFIGRSQQGRLRVHLKEFVTSPRPQATRMPALNPSHSMVITSKYSLNRGTRQTVAPKIVSWMGK